MIIHINKNIEKSIIEQLCREINAYYFKNGEKYVLVNSSKYKQISDKYKDIVEEVYVFDDDIQLSSKKYFPETRIVKVSNLEIGHDKKTLIIAGPCSVESEKQIRESAQFLKKTGVHALRGGCYKPRTSPYSFQGLGKKGLKLLDKIREEFGLIIVTEVKDATHVDEVIEFADIVQIGAKSMYDHGILKKCGKCNKAILLKRSFGATLQEFVQAAEFILSEGNPNVILCERGIRTFETKTRFTIDLCGAIYLKEHTNLPVILDPSHAMGKRYGVPALAKACLAMGIDGLLIEVHPDPDNALSDSAQQLTHKQFSELFKELKKIAKAIGKEII